ncbi:MAG: hypothetical protein DI565_10070 [Ancylobacter novellus]|uniref:Barstar (barnase inhibitor) domain-containing protein n=1 Tax=Ancylobacter novellus TaxID=921 RepID=A0A2W5KL28_ANCNO|nr:MAG: hypothetical protein DI565_10070 [Ancylobacter novellus]
MRPPPESFRFEADLTGRINGRSFYWRLPGDISARHELLAAFSQELWFPRDFGHNWDALSDCLRDLGWMSDRRIVLVHERLPRLPEDDLKRYLAVLRDAVRWWRFEDLHDLEVVFPKTARGRIAALSPPRG